MIEKKIARPLQQKTIGIVGGASNIATGEYYRIINSEVNNRLGGWEIAETLIAGMNFGNIQAFVRAEDWDGLSAYIEDKVKRLKAGGADIIICVSNTLHRHIEPIVAKYELPFIHIADPTGQAINESGLKRIALFGTRPTMEMDYLKERYRKNYGLEIIVPNEEERTAIDHIIFDELVKSNIRDESRMRYLEVVERLVQEEGIEGLILGCTEIFLLLKQSDRPTLPMFNTTELHCSAVVSMALNAD